MCIYVFIYYFFENLYKPIIISKYSIPEKIECLADGWSKKATRVFWNYYFYPELPTVQDVFEDNGIFTVILSCMYFNTHAEYYERSDIFFNSKWALYFHLGNSYIYQDQPINIDNPIFGQCKANDGYQKILVLQFEIPEKYQNKYNYATIQLVQTRNLKKVKFQPLNVKEVTYNPSYQYKETELQGYQNYTKIMMKPIKFSRVYKYGLFYRCIPFCQIRDSFSYSKEKTKPKKSFMKICTQNLIFTDKKRNIDLLRWALYHIDQGFETPVVYFNKIVPKNNQHPTDYESYLKLYNKAMKTLKKAIDDKIIKLVTWEFPYAFYFHDQLGQEASCIYRNKRRTKWLGINDVDEFFYNPNPKTKDTVNVTLKKIYYKDFAKQNGGILAPNVWMKIDEDKIYQDNVFNEMERTKCIIIPDNVDSFTVHLVDKGLPTVSLKQNNIVNAHFKNVSKDFYSDLKYSQKMTDIYHKYTKLAKFYLNLTKNRD